MSFHGPGDFHSNDGKSGHLDIRIPRTVDLSRGVLPIMAVLALLALPFSVGTVWNSSAKDIQALQRDMQSLATTVKEIQTSLRTTSDRRLERRDLLIFCYTLSNLNSGFKCPSS